MTGPAGVRATAGLPSATALARQPIVDRDGAPYGYELLFRGEGVADHTAAGDRATARVLVGAACDIGWRALGGGRPLFLNVGAGMIYDAALELAPPACTVLEVLEGVDVDDRLVERLQVLRGQGYDLALDDFEPGSGADRLIPLAGFVKLDVTALPLDELPSLVAQLHERGVLAIAERVETREVLDRCVAAGFDLFQGFWFAHPAEQPVMAMSPQRVLCLRLLALLAADDPDLRAVEQLVTSDTALVVRTLRMANSAAAGTSRQIGSVRQAIVLVGPRTLAGWVALMVVAHQPGENPLTAAEVLVQARACEIVAGSREPAMAGSAFLAGLAAGLVDLGGVGADELLDGIGATAQIRAAVHERSGPLGQLVADVVAHVGGERPASDLSVQLAHLSALAWYGELSRLA
ncbi:EAL and HDOD domain-containing protein [Angustibacter aerolatus]